jgi:2-dehydro-3-deoxyphosphooctonate aldolase (KDO 8-P synthase)
MFKLIAGPCVIESEELVFEVANHLNEVCKKLGIELIFKSSFDKANRTSIYSYRGPGLERGIEILDKVKKTFKLKVLTDIHEPYQAEKVAAVVDYIQIPAFLCRQTDLLCAAAKTGKSINVKKAQFLAPWDMKNVIKKIEECGNNDILLTERGTCFGYNNLIVDMTSIVEMKKFGYPVIFDATHSVQKPGGKGDSTGGNREYISYLAKAAIAVGADGIFIEVHPNPDNALSDGPNMLALENVESLLLELKSIYLSLRRD